MKLARVIAAAIVLLPGSGSADELASLAEARALADRAVGLFREERFADGYGALRPYWPLTTDELDGLARETSAQWSIVRERFGASIDTVFVAESDVADSFVRFVYLQKFERHSIRWLFTFYRPRAGWIVNGVSFDDDIEALLGSQ